MTNVLEFLPRFSGVFSSYRLELSLAVNTFICVCLYHLLRFHQIIVKLKLTLSCILGGMLYQNSRRMSFALTAP